MSGRIGLSLALLAALVAPSACGSRSLDATPAHAKLGGEIVARVGDVDLPATEVASVARARRVTPRAALALLVEDAVAAKAALTHGVDRTPEVQYAILSTKARATLDRVHDEAYATPPTDDEVKELSALDWQEVDVPEAMVAVHAVVMRPKAADTHVVAAAKAVAAAIVTAVAGATDADDFQAKASAVAHPDLEVVVQPLAPFAADGRVVEAGNSARYDMQFVAGAAGLADGATSGVVESAFGWHVIRMIEHRPRRVVPFDARRAMFAEHVHAKRAHDAIARIEAAVGAREPVGYENGVDEILSGALPVIRGDEAAPVAANPP